MITFKREIPKTIFFIHFDSGKDLSLITYLAIKSAIEANQDCEVILYTDNKSLPGDWGRAITKIHNLKVMDIPSFDKIRNVEYAKLSFAHKADILRLQILYATGGIYLDTDVISNRPFFGLIDDLLGSQASSIMNSTVILGKEEVYGKFVGYANAVMIASAESTFLNRWLDGFDKDKSLWKGLRSEGYDKFYTELSVKYSKFLGFLYPEEIIEVSRGYFYYPNYTPEELNHFFLEDYDGSFDRCYAFHLWGNASSYDYLKDLTKESIKSSNSNFASIVKRYLD
ncbi:hypothetical protein IPJ91_03665 [bacterium]|nr:MAG: hypothetical protein IPJ91_03665 [bacterium]